MIPSNKIQMPSPTRVIRGDPAARRLGLTFLAVLAVITIGTGVGIGVGNIAHYRYFSQYNQTSFNYSLLEQLI